MSKFFFFKPHFSRYSLSSPLKSTIPGSHLRGTGACLKHPPTPRVVPSLGQPSPQGACPTCCRPTTLAPSGLDPHAGCCLCFSPLPSPPLNPPPPHPAPHSVQARPWQLLAGPGPPWPAVCRKRGLEAWASLRPDPPSDPEEGLQAAWGFPWREDRGVPARLSAACWKAQTVAPTVIYGIRESS